MYPTQANASKKGPPLPSDRRAGKEGSVPSTLKFYANLPSIMIL